MRKLKEIGLTESLDIGYRLSPRRRGGRRRLAGRPARTAPRPTGTPSDVGAPAARALRAAGLTTLEAVAAVTEAEVAAMHGVGPVALTKLREALARHSLVRRE